LNPYFLYRFDIRQVDSGLHQKHIVPSSEWYISFIILALLQSTSQDENRLFRISRGKGSLSEGFEGLVIAALTLPGKGIWGMDFLQGRPPGKGPSLKDVCGLLEPHLPRFKFRTSIGNGNHNSSDE